MQLQHLYMKTAEFLDHLDTEFIKTLQKSWGDLKTNLKESIEQVAPREQYVVLVAGKILTVFIARNIEVGNRKKINVTLRTSTPQSLTFEWSRLGFHVQIQMFEPPCTE